MNAIQSFALTSEETFIEAPVEDFLTIQMHNNKPCIWCIVNTDKTPKKFKVILLGSDWECQKINASKYIGTIQDAQGCAWHCFWENIVAQRSPDDPIFTLFSTRRGE